MKQCQTGPWIWFYIYKVKAFIMTMTWLHICSKTFTTLYVEMTILLNKRTTFLTELLILTLFTGVCTIAFIIQEKHVNHFQSQYLITPSQPAVATLDVSCGCHIACIHTSSWALNFEYNFVLFQSQIYSLPSASPDIKYL